MSEKAKANKQEYDLKYVKQNIKRIQVSFNFQSDEDIKMYDFLNDIKISKNRYIKNLIKKDKKRLGKDQSFLLKIFTPKYKKHYTFSVIYAIIILQKRKRTK